MRKGDTEKTYTDARKLEPGKKKTHSSLINSSSPHQD